MYLHICPIDVGYWSTSSALFHFVLVQRSLLVLLFSGSSATYCSTSSENWKSYVARGILNHRHLSATLFPSGTSMTSSSSGQRRRSGVCVCVWCTYLHHLSAVTFSPPVGCVWFWMRACSIHIWPVLCLVINHCLSTTASRSFPGTKGVIRPTFQETFRYGIERLDELISKCYR